jgi:hypothetical protein
MPSDGARPSAAAIAAPRFAGMVGFRWAVMVNSVELAALQIIDYL